MITPFPPGSLLSACIRDSGHEDQELSALHQERSIREWCEKNGYSLSDKIFTDSRSGKTAAKRTEFQAMMAYFRQPDVPEAGVVVWSFSRFARNALEAQYYRAELKQHGKILYSITEPLPDGPEALIIEAVYDFAHQKYLDDLSENVSTGLRDLVAIHGCIPGTPPKGFMCGPEIVTGTHRNGQPRIGHRWLPDPDYVPRLRQAFQMRSTGASLNAIHTATQLFNSINCYHQFFTNKLYIGTLKYAGLIIENYCDPVINRPMWDAVQAYQQRFSGHRHVRPNSPDHPRRLASPYLLSGLVFCLRCAAPLCGHTSTVKEYKYASYRCTNAKNRRSCAARHIPAAPLENEILSAVQTYVLQPDVLSAMYDQQRLASGTLIQDRQHELDLLRKRHHQTTLKISHLTDAIASTGHSPALLDRLKQLEAALTGLESQIRASEAQTAPIPELSLDQITQLCAATREKLLAGDVAIRRRILNSLIKQIAVDRDQLTIHGVAEFYLPIPQGDKTDIVPIASAPGGAILYRHNFIIK